MKLQPKTVTLQIVLTDEQYQTLQTHGADVFAYNEQHCWNKKTTPRKRKHSITKFLMDVPHVTCVSLLDGVIDISVGYHAHTSAVCRIMIEQDITNVINDYLQDGSPVFQVP